MRMHDNFFLESQNNLNANILKTLQPTLGSDEEENGNNEDDITFHGFDELTQANNDGLHIQVDGEPIRPDD